MEIAMVKRTFFMPSLFISTFCVFSLFGYFCTQVKLLPGTYKKDVVVSTQKVASEVGALILKRGGNAVDAAVAVSYALAVIYPTAGNIGGGGFMVIRKPSGEATTIDYREKAPGRASRDMYLDTDGKVIRNLSTLGVLSAGVPGTVAGTLYALEKYGTMSRDKVIEPAIELADTGWILGGRMGGNSFKRFPSTNAIFNKPDSTPYQKGERFIQKDLAATLKTIVKLGKDGFYKGRIADLIVKTMEQYNGLITLEDLANYQAIERPPIRGTYRGFEIISMPPPSAGGICLVELLNILERYPIGTLGWNTPETVHFMVEAERRVYADRAQYLGDPDFIKIPVEQLISKEYANKRAQDIQQDKATPSEQVSYGEIKFTDTESKETTHYSVVDKNGMAVAVTTTLNGGYGSYLVVDGAGFLLNNEMDDFSIKPGEPNMYGLTGSEANAIAPDKRMLSSMTPTIIVKDGKPFMVVGSPGGSTIMTTVLQVIMNVIDHGKTIQEAVSAPRFHHQWLPDIVNYEREAFTDSTMARLTTMGYTLRLQRGSIGDAHSIIIDPVKKLLYGGADPRSSSSSSAGR